MLASNDFGKRKKKKHKCKTDDAYDSQVNDEVLHQKSKEFEKEKGIKRKHKHTRQLDNQNSSGGWLLPEIKIESETETSIKHSKKKKRHHESEENSSGGWLLPEIKIDSETETCIKHSKKRKRHHESEDISCNVEQLVESGELHLAEISTKKKKKKKRQHDKESNESWLLQSISTLVTEHGRDPETSSKPKKKKKKKHRHEIEDEIAIQDDGGFMPSNENLPETEPETSRKRKKKAKKHHRKNEDKIDSLSFDISWILEPKALPDHASSSKVKHRINTSQASRDNENCITISSLDDTMTMVDPSQEPSENDVPSALDVQSQEVLVDVRSAADSAVHPSGTVPSTADEVPSAANEVPSAANEVPSAANEVPSAANEVPSAANEVPSTADILVQDVLICILSANDSPLKPSTDFPSTTNLSSTQNAANSMSEITSTNVPSVHESSVGLSKRTSSTHNSVVHFSRKPSSEPGSVCDLTVDLSRRSNVSIVNSLDILQSKEHLANDSSSENPVIASSKARPSSAFHSAKRQLFTEEIPNELSAVRKAPLRTRKVHCIKTSTVEAQEGSHPIVQNSSAAVSKNSPAGSKNSVQAVSKKSRPVRGVRCVKTRAVDSQEDDSENLHSSQKSVKRGRCMQRKSSLAERQEKRRRHPGLPKQPVSVFLRFMRDCRKELLEKNPKLKSQEICVEAGNRYRKLRAEDKEKYVIEFKHETKKYNAAIKTFIEDHPEHKNHWAGLKRSKFLERNESGRVDIISGEQLYINKRTQEHLRTQADDDVRKVKATYRKEWNRSLDEQEKVVYILEAKKLNSMNAASEEELSRTEDSKEAKIVTSSNYREIEEQFLRENLVPPPVNGYQLFKKENSNAELPFGETNRRWKRELSQDERSSYSTRAKIAREAYKKNLAEFEKKEEIAAEFPNLPIPKSLRNALKEEHKLLVSVRKKSMEGRKKHPDVKTGRPPITGRLLFFKEQMATVNHLDFKLRFAELNRQWISHLSQDSYTARAKAAYDKFTKEHPELYQNEVDEESEERDYRRGHNSVEKTRTRKRRLR